jgi:hypothetical protein
LLATQFVPDLSHIIPFEASATGSFTVDAVPVFDEDGFEVTTGAAAAAAAAADDAPEKALSEETIAAAAILDSVLKNLTDNFSSTADYFKVRAAAAAAAAAAVTSQLFVDFVQVIVWLSHLQLIDVALGATTRNCAAVFSSLPLSPPCVFRC